MGIQDYPTTQAEAQAADKIDAKEKANRAVFEELLNRWYLHDGEANFGILKSWAGPDGLITLEPAENLLRGRRVSPTLAPVTREDLVDEIMDFHKNLSGYEARNFRLRLGTWSLRQLRAEINRCKFLEVVKTKEDAKKFLKGVRDPAIPKWPGWPTMLPRVFDKATFRYHETGAFLYALAFAAKHNDAQALFEYRKYVRLYSAAQIDWWVARGQAKAEAEALNA